MALSFEKHFFSASIFSVPSVSSVVNSLCFKIFGALC
jgi:hypothetical protein